jgi:hypothetical protein
MRIYYGDKLLYIKEFQLKIFWKKLSKVFFLKYLKTNILFKLKKLKFRFQFNKSKFEELYIYKISEFISKIYNKKLEFNIINLKSIIINSDLFTEILTLKLKKKGANVARKMFYILDLGRVPTTSIVKRKLNLHETYNLNINTSFFLKSESFENFLKRIYTNIIDWKNDSINTLNLFKKNFFFIKYKELGGIRLEVNGRLSKRYRADRAIHKLMWRGGLKNLDSSYNGFSSIKLRGYMNSNVEHSMFKSKRRIGAFAVKGWISGK